MKTTADTRDPWSLILAVAAATSVGLLPGTVTGFLVGGLIDSLGLSGVQAGALVTLELCAVAVTAMLVAPFMTRLSAVRMAQAGVLLALAMQFGSILLDSFWMLVPARLATGVGEGLALAGATATVAAALNPDRVYGYSLAGFMALSVVLIPVLAETLGRLGLDGGFGLLGVLYLLLLAPLPTLGRVFPRSMPAGPAPRLSRKRVAVVLVGMLLYGLGPAPMWAFMERAGVDIGLGVDRVGVIYSYGLVAGFVGSLVAGKLGARWGRTRPLLLGQVLLGLSCLGFGYVNGDADYTFMVAFFLLTYMFTMTFLLAAVAVFDPSGRLGPAASGFFMLMLGLGATVGGLLLENGSYATLGWFGLIGCSLTGLFFAVLGRFLDARRESPPGQQAP